MSNVFENKLRNAIDRSTLWIEDDALPVVALIFDDIVSALKQTRQFQDTSRDPIDLLLADCRTKAEWQIGGIVDGIIDVENVIRNILEGLEP